jgi:hypothetical protein
MSGVQHVFITSRRNDRCARPEGSAASAESKSFGIYRTFAYEFANETPFGRWQNGSAFDAIRCSGEAFIKKINQPDEAAVARDAMYTVVGW